MSKPRTRIGGSSAGVVRPAASGGAKPSNVSSASVPKARGVRTRGDASIDGLTKQLRELVAALNEADVMSRVRVGEVLTQGKAKLEHGAWTGWVKGNVPQKVRWAQVTMELAAWSRESPAVFGRVRRLGSGKVTELMRLRTDQLEELLSRREIVVPSTGERMTIEAITGTDLREVVNALLGKPPKEAAGVDALIAAARGSVKKTIASIQWMIANKSVVSPELVEDLHDDLAHWLDALEGAFGLEKDE